MIGDNPIADDEGAEAVGIPAVLVRQRTREDARCCNGFEDVVAMVERTVASTGGPDQPKS
jgi:hypothetical protein